MLDTMDYIRNVLQALKPGNYSNMNLSELLTTYDELIKGV